MEEEPICLHLPALRRVAISNSGKLRLDGSSFLDATRLENLSLSGHGSVTVMPDCFAGLTALATLELRLCGFAVIPTALTALQDSLTALALSDNDDLQLTKAGVMTLLALRKLRTLELLKRDLVDALDNRAAAAAVSAQFKYTPAAWSSRSLQRLVTLPNAFLARHGHVLDLQLADKDDTDEEQSSGEEEEE